MMFESAKKIETNVRLYHSGRTEDGRYHLTRGHSVMACASWTRFLPNQPYLCRYSYLVEHDCISNVLVPKTTCIPPLPLPFGFMC